MRNATENAIFYAARKSEQDMPAALEACTADFELVTPAFNSRLSGRENVLGGMALFFALFPDYFVEADETIANDHCVIMVGHVRLTPNFAAVGLKGEGRTARLAFSARFETHGGLIRKETFLIDLPDLCHQSGLPLSHMLRIAEREHVIAAA